MCALDRARQSIPFETHAAGVLVLLRLVGAEHGGDDAAGSPQAVAELARRVSPDADVDEAETVARGAAVPQGAPAGHHGVVALVGSVAVLLYADRLVKGEDDLLIVHSISLAKKRLDFKFDQQDEKVLIVKFLLQYMYLDRALGVVVKGLLEGENGDVVVEFADVEVLVPDDPPHA